MRYSDFLRLEIGEPYAAGRALPTMTTPSKRVAAVVFAAMIANAYVTSRQAHAAGDLSLAKGLSFTDDSSDNFPITGSDLSDGQISPSQPTLVFFGTSHCWDTNREAERLVAVYPKYRDKIHIVVVDLNRPSAAQQALILKYYRGYIPTVTLIDSNGRVVYDRAGETAAARGDTANLESLLQSAK